MELSVSEKSQVLNPSQVSFKERELQLEQMERAEEREGRKHRGSPYKSFLQMNKETIKLQRKLIAKNPLAYEVWLFLAENMDNYNAVICSYKVMEETFEVSRMTLYRAIKLLEKDEYIRILKSGTSNVYALNDKMVWSSWGTNYKYSKFSANVIVSASEQSEEVQKKIKTITHKEIKVE